MVTPTDSYNVLVGNDWLRMADADLLLSKGQLRIRLGLDQYEEVPIDVDYGLNRVNTLIHVPEERSAEWPLTMEQPAELISNYSSTGC